MPDPLEFEAAADDVPPIFPDHAPAPRHRVKASERTLPPRPLPEDAGQMTMDDSLGTTPERRPRKVPVKPHHRRNPRRKETQMTTVTTGGRASAMAAARARSTDPATSHAAAASIDVNPSQIVVLRAFQAKAADDAASFIPDYVEHGFTDEALVGLLEERGTKFSPSRLRTARRELADLGLVEESGDRRPTKRGRQADVYVLTDRGASFEIPSC